MKLAFIKFSLTSFSIVIFLASCGVKNLQSYTSQSVEVIKENVSKLSIKENEEPKSMRPLVSLLGGSSADVDLNANFSQVMKTAIMQDPTIVAAKQDYLAQQAAIKVSIRKNSKSLALAASKMYLKNLVELH